MYKYSFLFYSGESSGEPKYSIPVITALSFLVIAIPLFIYRRTVWQCIRRQNDPNNERQALNPENIRNDYAANHIIEGDDLPIQPHDSSENRNAANSNYSNFSSSARINNREQNHRSQNPDVWRDISKTRYGERGTSTGKKWWL